MLPLQIWSSGTKPTIFTSYYLPSPHMTSSPWRPRARMPAERVHKGEHPGGRVGWREYCGDKLEDREEKWSGKALAPNPKGSSHYAITSGAATDDGDPSAPKDCIIELSSCIP